MIKNTYGDGAFIMMNTGSKPEISDDNLLTTIAYNFNGKVTYALEGSIFAAGTALSWLADSLQLIDNVPESRQAAMNSEDDDEVYVVPAFNGLGAPYWEQDVRGAVFGLTGEPLRMTSSRQRYSRSPMAQKISSRPWKKIPACIFPN